MIYDDLRATARELFSEFGLPVTITRTTAGLHDRINDTFGTATVTTITGSGILGQRKVKNQDGTTRTASSVRLNVAPMINDRLVLGTRSFVVMDVGEINPDGGSPMAYTAVLA